LACPDACTTPSRGSQLLPWAKDNHKAGGCPSPWLTGNACRLWLLPRLETRSFLGSAPRFWATPVFPAARNRLPGKAVVLPVDELRPFSHSSCPLPGAGACVATRPWHAFVRPGAEIERPQGQLLSRGAVHEAREPRPPLLGTKANHNRASWGQPQGIGGPGQRREARPRNRPERGKAMWDWVTPQDFGAVGDGITDDSMAFQQALNSGNYTSVGGVMPSKAAHEFGCRIPLLGITLAQH
jgi:hypothetical protein